MCKDWWRPPSWWNASGRNNEQLIAELPWKTGDFPHSWQLDPAQLLMPFDGATPALTDNLRTGEHSVVAPPTKATPIVVLKLDDENGELRRPAAATGNPSQCLLPNGTMAACGPGNDQCAAHGEFSRGPGVPQFHIMDLSCGEQDPNGPIYDPVHGVYHLFYQDHLGMKNAHTPWLNGRNGPVWGHVLSRDLVKWAHMPVALWNDEWYDDLAIYSGSATVVGENPVLIYAAVGKPDNAAYQFNYGLAVPKNRSDPLLTEWVKPEYSPIINHSASDDPSSAWQTADKKEWRFIGPSTEYASADFITWHAVGKHGLPQGDDPSLFPLRMPSASTASTSTSTSTAEGNWIGPVPGVPGPGVRRCGTVDGGHDQSSPMCKGSTSDDEMHSITEAALRARCEADATCAGYAQYLPRDGQPSKASYFHPVTDTSTTHPDPHWRTYTLAGKSPAPPAPSSAEPTHVHKWTNRCVDRMQVGSWVDGAHGKPGTWTPYASDPWHGQRVIDQGSFCASKDFFDPVGKRRILWGWAVNGVSGLGVEPGEIAARVAGCRSGGVDPTSNNCLSTQSIPRAITWNQTLRQLLFAPLQEQQQLRGKPLFAPLGPQALAAGAVRTLGSWPETHAGNQSEVEVVFVLPKTHPSRFGVAVMGSGGGSGTYFYVDFKPPAAASGAGGDSVYTVSVGATQTNLSDASALKSGGTVDALRLTASDSTVSIRIFVDNTFAECFWAGGRVVMSVPLTPTDESSMAVAAAVGDVTLRQAKAWAVESIWVSREEVLKRPPKSE